MVNEQLLAFIRSYKDSMYYGKAENATFVTDGPVQFIPKKEK